MVSTKKRGHQIWLIAAHFLKAWKVSLFSFAFSSSVYLGMVFIRKWENFRFSHLFAVALCSVNPCTPPLYPIPFHIQNSNATYLLHHAPAAAPYIPVYFALFHSATLHSLNEAHCGHTFFRGRWFRGVEGEGRCPWPYRCQNITSLFSYFKSSFRDKLENIRFCGHI